MDLSDIQLIKTIAEMGSISGASQALHLSQPTVSKRLSRLEQTLGMQLFHRLSRGMAPTSTAEYILSQEPGLSNHMQAIERQVQRMADLAAEAIPAVMGPEADAETVSDAVAAMARIPQAAYRQILQTLVTFNRREDQHRISCPCCLIAGAHDDNSPARVMEKMAERLETATFHIVESAGHLVNSEAGDECNAIIEGFLEDLRADTETV